MNGLGVSRHWMILEGWLIVLSGYFKALDDFRGLVVVRTGYFEVSDDFGVLIDCTEWVFLGTG